MKITLEHLGKTVQYRYNEPFLIEGFEREGTRLYMYGCCVGTIAAGGVRPNFPQHPNKVYYELDLPDDEQNFSLVPEAVDFFDFKRFGCNEPIVRDLINELDKRYKLKEK